MLDLITQYCYSTILYSYLYESFFAMKQNNFLNSLTKEELIKLIEAYSKNWLAMDGVWFQSIERKFGMDEAMHHDREAWKSFTITEARRIKQFLGLPEHAGLEGLAKALQLRFYANINNDEIILGKDNKTLVYRTLECHVQTAISPRISIVPLVYRTLECHVQTARKRKQMEYHPCKSVGIIEYSGFAKTIDERITCECLSCYPDITDNSCCCAWQFTLNE